MNSKYNLSEKQIKRGWNGAGMGCAELATQDKMEASLENKMGHNNTFISDILFWQTLEAKTIQLKFD